MLQHLSFGVTDKYASRWHTYIWSDFSGFELVDSGLGIGAVTPWIEFALLFVLSWWLDIVRADLKQVMSMAQGRLPGLQNNLCQYFQCVRFLITGWATAGIAFTRWFWGFSPHMGDTIHVLAWNLAQWSPDNWYAFYCPTEDHRLSEPRHFKKSMQPMPIAVNSGDFFVTDCPWWDSTLVSRCSVVQNVTTRPLWPWWTAICENLFSGVFCLIYSCSRRQKLEVTVTTIRRQSSVRQTDVFCQTRLDSKFTTLAEILAQRSTIYQFSDIRAAAEVMEQPLSTLLASAFTVTYI